MRPDASTEDVAERGYASNEKLTLTPGPSPCAQGEGSSVANATHDFTAGTL